MMKYGRASVVIAALMALGACAHHGGHKKAAILGDRVPILVSETDASADRSMSGVEVLLPPPAPNADWTQPGGNSAHDMGHLALAASPSRLWTASIDGGNKRERLGAPPVIGGGKLFVVDVTATVHAFNPDTGASLWSTAIAKEDKKTRGAVFGGGVSFDDGVVYATDGLGDVAALDANTGAVKWHVKPGGPLRGSPSVSNGNLYLLTQDNQLFALSETDGSVSWTTSGSIESQGIFGVAAPAAAQGTVVAGFSSGELNGYRYENGRSLWQDALSRTTISTSVSSLSDIDANPVIDQGKVYAVGQGGRMVSLDLASGQRVWEQNFAGISTPWVAGEWVFVVSDDAKLICIARGSGKIRWISQLPGFKNEKKKKNAIDWFGPVLAGGKLWLTGSRGQIISASATDGKFGDPIEGKVPYSLPPIVVNNTLYTLDDKGKLTAWR
jgi:outer membrane protein assembly factor BamB